MKKATFKLSLEMEVRPDFEEGVPNKITPKDYRAIKKVLKANLARRLCRGDLAIYHREGGDTIEYIFTTRAKKVKVS